MENILNYTFNAKIKTQVNEYKSAKKSESLPGLGSSFDVRLTVMTSSLVLAC